MTKSLEPFEVVWTATGTTVSRIRTDLIFRRCWNLITPACRAGLMAARARAATSPHSKRSPTKPSLAAFLESRRASRLASITAGDQDHLADPHRRAGRAPARAVWRCPIGRAKFCAEDFWSGMRSGGEPYDTAVYAISPSGHAPAMPALKTAFLRTTLLFVGVSVAPATSSSARATAE
jgi:hypothetical protein